MINTESTTRRRPPLEKATLFHCKRDKSGLCTHPECAPVVLAPGSNAVKILEKLSEIGGCPLPAHTREDRKRLRDALRAGGYLPQLTPSEIADKLGLHRSEVSRQLRQMLKARYVSRLRSGRNFYYKLTSSGVGAIGFAYRNEPTPEAQAKIQTLVSEISALEERGLDDEIIKAMDAFADECIALVRDGYEISGSGPLRLAGYLKLLCREQMQAR